jgi:hypothetical protein
MDIDRRLRNGQQENDSKRIRRENTKEELWKGQRRSNQQGLNSEERSSEAVNALSIVGAETGGKMEHRK